MTELLFNPYYIIPCYTITEDSFDFPFVEGEVVTMRLFFGSPIPSIRDDNAEDMQGINSRLQVRLEPAGIERDSFVLCQVRSAMDQREYWLRFSYDLHSVLQAVILDQPQESDFPFQAGQIVRVPLKVLQVEEIELGYGPYTINWRASLVPHGERLCNLISTQVVREEV